MTKRVLCLVADGVEELELVAPVDVLRRAGAEVVLAAVGESTHVTGRNHLVLHADQTLGDVKAEDFDLLFLPGGAAVAKLRAELAAQTLDMETEIGLKDLKLAHFKDKLVNQRHDVTMMLSYMSKDSAANTQTTRRHWARHVQELKDEIAKCEDQLQVEQVSHAAQVKFLEAKIKKCTERKLLTEQINNGQTSNTLKAQGVKDPKEQEQLIELMEEGRKELLHKLLELQVKLGCRF